MILCIGDTVPPTTEKSRILRKILIFILIVQIAFAFIKFYHDMWAGISELVSCLILWCAQAQLNYCNCVVYIFFCLLNIFVILANFATDIQNQVNVTGLQDSNYRLGISTLSMTFYIVGIYFSFQAYKEFKGIAFDIYAATTNDQMVYSKTVIGNQEPVNMRQDRSFISQPTPFQNPNIEMNSFQQN